MENSDGDWKYHVLVQSTYSYSFDEPSHLPAPITVAAVRFQTPSFPNGNADKVCFRSPPSLGQVTGQGDATTRWRRAQLSSPLGNSTWRSRKLSFSLIAPAPVIFDMVSGFWYYESRVIHNSRRCLIFISSQLVSSSLSSCAPIISIIIAVRACSFPRKLKCGGAGANASSLNRNWLETGRVSSHAIGSMSGS